MMKSRRSREFFSLLCCAATLVPACSRKSASDATADPKSLPSHGQQDLRQDGITKSDVSNTKPPSPKEMMNYTNASNRLGFDLYREQAKKPGNIVFSPTSISLAFGMTLLGASGETASEMQRVLHFDDGDTVHNSAAAALATWNATQSNYTLRVVNRLFGEKKYEFEAKFLSRVAETYLAPLEKLDFAGAAEPQREHINQWVMEQTEDRIKDLLPSGSIASDTRLVLVNAIYFLGNWTKKFTAKATTEKPFNIGGGKTADVPMMRQTNSFIYSEEPGFKLLQMPYKGGRLAMTVLLPDADKGIDSIEEQLDAENVEAWLAKLRMNRVYVELPTFELKDVQLPLKELLMSLGMESPFSAGKADFSSMSKPSSADDELYISGAFHSAFIKVNETGTEAAAATAVVMATRGAPMIDPKQFIVDRPFLFMIRDLESGAILFMGRVNDPR